MTSRRRRGRRWIGSGLQVALVACVGCSGAPGDEAGDAGARGRLRSVQAPNLDPFPQPVREQVASQLRWLDIVAESEDADSATLGEAYGLAGRLLLAYELKRAAEPALLNAAALLPDDVRWHYYLGYLYQGQGEADRAIRHFERVLDLQSDYVPARIHLAVAYRDLGRDSEAVGLLESTLRIDPENAVAHVLLGHLAAGEDPAAGAEHYEAALRLQPDASMIRYPLSHAYRRLGELERSREVLARRGQASARFHDPLIEQLAEIREGAGSELNRGNELAAQGRLREAAALFEAATERDSTGVAAYLNLGMAAAQLRDYEKAVRALERTLRLDPSNTRAHYTLGMITLLAGDPAREDEAAEHFRAALRADPGNGGAHLALANLLWRRGDCRDAIGHYEEFLVVRPADVEARIRRAICHAYLGDYREARRLLEVGVEARPDEPRLQESLVRVLAASPDASVRDGARALEIAKRLSATYRQPEILESLAMAYAETGHYSEAIQHQEEAIREAERRGLPRVRLDDLRNTLRRYQAGQPSRAPWRPTLFGG